MKMTMTEAEALGRIKMGVNVDIKRSDGRIHSAVVSGINMETRSVTVEWFERGETKGKEIELEAILSLNQDLAPQNDNSNGVPNKLSKYIPRPSITANNRQATGIPTASSGSTNGNSGNTAAATGAANGGMRTRNKANRQTVTNLELQAQNQVSSDESNMPPPSIPANPQLANGSENIPPKRGQLEVDTVGKAAGGVTTRGRRNIIKEKISTMNEVDNDKSEISNSSISSQTKNEKTGSSFRKFIKKGADNISSKTNTSAVLKAINAKGKYTFSENSANRSFSLSNSNSSTIEKETRSSLGSIHNAKDARKQNTKAVNNLEDRRRSNVVKEVERLKKNREERRAKQAEVLEEKVAQKNVDPGNPNWEFLCMINEYQETLKFVPLKDGDAVHDHQISVCVRKRPLSNKEIKKKEVDVICTPNQNQIIVHEPKTKVDLTKYLDNQHFRFDYAFDETASNELVYKYTASPLVRNIFEGGMATCFAYGQTGSGKTHTMGGEFHGKTQDSKNGIYAMATKDVFKYLNSPKYKNLKLQVSCSYFEIYSGKVFDLLSGKSKLRVLEDGKQQVVVVGLAERVVTCVEDVLKHITSGNNLRTSGQTSANAHSSRSHAVFQIILRNNNPKKTLYGKFSLIDLAGNERGADTSSANRQTRMEGAEINKSLLALKECIRALGRKGSHLPFRASKLTQVLRDSFIGEKSKTCMIAMVSPTLSCCEHSLNTMRYADRVKELGAADPAAGGNENGQRLDEEGNGHMESEDSNGVMLAMRDDGVLSPEDSDLAQLRSLNEGELSADWYNFQEAISHLQLLEEELVESHRSTIVGMQQWTKDDLSLLNMTNEVDYDQDAYCQQLEDMISEKIDTFTSLRDKARNFRKCLNDEEAKSRQLMNRHY